MPDTDANRPDGRDPLPDDVETPEGMKPWERARRRLRERLRELVAGVA